ncbi:ABC-type multidrug transport system fused ATPase/permease subunit [Salana multivorans]|uniref:ABC-type multidrug transport system fused ATPase/permease subunit n=1 Tax=Salana multivorans TaxID=120377 RepID=A0A3N2DCM1_9MICO|nr:ABC-type multidrug transport system fused ATPase/permease subunit [Salana multivorans]
MSEVPRSVSRVLDLYRLPASPAPTRSVARFLLWRAREQRWLVAAGIALGIVNALTQAAAPWILGQVVGAGLSNGLSRTLLLWCGAMLAIWVVRAFTGMLAHQVDVAAWLRACLGTVSVVGRHVTETGDALRREVPTGEVLATVSTDGPRIGEIYSFLGRFLGSIIAYLVVAVLLMRSSVALGIGVLLGVPLVAAVLAFIVRPLQRLQGAQREQNGKLTTLGSDTVSGLRILRGIGGEEVFTARYRRQSHKVRDAGVAVAGVQSLLDAMQALLPGLFLAVVMWIGARMALAGDLSVADLVMFYGFAAYLTNPLSSATQGITFLTRARIAIRRVQRVLNVAPAVSDTASDAAAADVAADTTDGTGADRASASSTLPRRGELHDPASGLTVAPGRTVALVSADPDSSAALAMRLGRLEDTADPAASPTLGGVPLRSVPVAEVRERIVVSEATPTLFTGVLADELDSRGDGDRTRVRAALAVADAADVIDSVPDGLEGRLEEKGRSLSGGQRQRAALARALLTDADVLVLIEPTSAVDAHTEARIARSLPASRRERTTVVVTASPLMLDQMDEVVLLQDGVVRARGTHEQLMDDAERAARGEVDRPGRPGGLTADRGEAAIAYRRVVSRSVDDSPAETPGVPEDDAADPHHQTDQTCENPEEVTVR